MHTIGHVERPRGKSRVCGRTEALHQKSRGPRKSRNREQRVQIVVQDSNNDHTKCRRSARFTKKKIRKGDPWRGVETCVGAVNVHEDMTNSLVYQHNAR